METICVRLHRGDDLLTKIEQICAEKHLQAGVVLSAVGCVTSAVVRDAGGIRVCRIDEPCEIVSLMGTVSKLRCHLHIALSKKDLSTVGGHLMHGCRINTTCELVLAKLPGWHFGYEQDAETGYDEITMEEKQ